MCTLHYRPNIVSVSALWIPAYIHVFCLLQVSTRSSRTETVCDCKNQGSDQPTPVGTTFYAPYNVVDFKTIAVAQDALGRDPVIAIVAIIFFAYIFAVFWAWREDAKDQYKVITCITGNELFLAGVSEKILPQIFFIFFILRWLTSVYTIK